MVVDFYREKVGRRPTVHAAWAYLMEEIEELKDARSPEDELKELCDVIYTAIGYGYSRGWNVDRAFELVHQSNMTKERTESGKVQKGDGYVPPYLGGCLR